MTNTLLFCNKPWYVFILAALPVIISLIIAQKYGIQVYTALLLTFVYLKVYNFL